jgi:hypothetical protein
MAYVENAPSRGPQLQGPQPEISSPPQKLGLTREHIDYVIMWQDSAFPGGEPLSRQGDQFKQEQGEVGELVFGLTPEQLNTLPSEKRTRIAEEITDVVIAGIGELKVLGYTYDELRKRHEKSSYDPTQFSQLEGWQLDANGGDTPLSVRFGDFAEKSLASHKAYDQLGTDDEGKLTVSVEDLTEDQRLDLAKKTAETMTSGLSVLNGMGESFDEHFRNAYGTMLKKYDPELLRWLREAMGLDDSEAMAEAKRIHEKKFTESRAGEVVVFVPQVSEIPA